MIFILSGLINVLGVRILRNYQKNLVVNLDSIVLRLKVIKFQFNSLILEIYSLVLELSRNYKLVLGA